MQLLGKRIILTGGARGIGAAALRAFVGAGAEVVCLDVLDELGEQAVKAANQIGPGHAAYQHCDITKRAQTEAAVQRAVHAMSGLDALSHVAAVAGTSCPAETITDEEWDRIFAVNTRGTMIVNQAVFPFLRAAGGRIVNFSSLAGVQGMANYAHYAASKAAILGWTRTIAREWGRYDIAVNAVLPSARTELYERFRAGLPPEERVAHDEGLKSLVPLGGRLGDPDRDIAPALVFLISDAARFITGQSLPVDGGLLMLG